ncbi:MAG: cyclic nucleotide-binding domain-containing protein [Nitrospinota bacterium]
MLRDPFLDSDGNVTLPPKTIVQTLEKIKELRGFSKPQLMRIARLKPTLFGPKKFILSEGSSGIDTMVIILAGSVYIHKRVSSDSVKDDKASYEQVAEIQGPALIGENSFFTGLPRSAGVYANNRCLGIILDRESLLRLIALDKKAYFHVLSSLALENLIRVERTLTHYVGSLQIILSAAVLSQSNYYVALNKLKKEFQGGFRDIPDIEKFLVRVLMLVRELNLALETLYTFANLPELIIKSVNRKYFTIPTSDTSYGILKKIIDELTHTQTIILLDAINFKNVVLTSVIDSYDVGLKIIDYQSMVLQAVNIYRKFISQADMLGCLVETPKYKPPSSNTSLGDLIWDK